MTKLSVNINKIATLRNARGGNVPDLLKAAKDIQNFGGEGITIHPRPDERHIRYQDARDLKSVVHTELNIEGNPIPSFMSLIEEVKPEQVTLVPDAPDAITSDAGWDTITHQQKLKDLIAQLHDWGLRVSIFVDPVAEMVEGAAETGTDRVELYTEAYAAGYADHPEKAIEPYVKAAETASRVGLGINAGHDLDLKNLQYFAQHIPNLLEVSIGHALISDSLYLGLENTVNMYKAKLK